MKLDQNEWCMHRKNNRLDEKTRWITPRACVWASERSFERLASDVSRTRTPSA